MLNILTVETKQENWFQIKILMCFYIMQLEGSLKCIHLCFHEYLCNNILFHFCFKTNTLFYYQ
jgi:hypothetical protein